MLKKLMIGAGLVALLATPALAQSYDPAVGSGNIVTPNGHPLFAAQVPYRSYAPYYGGAYAYVPARRGYYHGRRWHYRHGWSHRYGY